MKLDGRRESTNVEDRRGRSAGTGSGFNMASGGGGFNILGLLLQLFMSNKSGGSGKRGGCGTIGLLVVGALLLYFLSGGDGLFSSLGDNQQPTTTPQQPTTTTPQDDDLARFTSQILAGTEDVWTAIFSDMGKTYRAPRLVIFSDAVRSGCGSATSSSGPFYCSADQTVYIDLSFFRNMKRQIGADGDFAYAYVIAHEVGHHVQYLLGDLDRVHAQMSRSSKTISNQLSVRLELQADFYAGVWANYDNKLFGSLEEGDIDEGLAAAQKIGDDYLQKKAQGYTVPESFNHGTSAQRSKWLRRGIQTGDIRYGDTFSPEYGEL